MTTDNTDDTQTTHELDTLTADANYLSIASSSMGVPLTELVAYSAGPEAVAQQHRAVIDSFLRADSDSTLAEMLKDKARFARAADHALHAAKTALADEPKEAG